VRVGDLVTVTGRDSVLYSSSHESDSWLIMKKGETGLVVDVELKSSYGPQVKVMRSDCSTGWNSVEVFEVLSSLPGESAP
jgi:hypothetical protein